MPITLRLKGNAEVDNQIIHNTLVKDVIIPPQSKIRVKYFDCDFEPFITEQYDIDNAQDFITVSLNTGSGTESDVARINANIFYSPINLCQNIEREFNELEIFNPAPGQDPFLPLSWKIAPNSDNKCVISAYNAGPVRPEKINNPQYWTLNNMHAPIGNNPNLVDSSLAGYASSIVNYPNLWFYDSGIIRAAGATDHIEVFFTATKSAKKYGWEINSGTYYYGLAGAYNNSGIAKLDGDVVSCYFSGRIFSFEVLRTGGANALFDSVDFVDFEGFRNKNIRMNANSRLIFSDCTSQYFDAPLTLNLQALPVNVGLTFSTKKLAHYLGFTDTTLSFHDTVTSTNQMSGDKVNATGFITLDGLGVINSYDASPDSKGSQNIIEAFKLPSDTYHVTLDNTPVEYLEMNNYSEININELRARFITDTQNLTFRGTPSIVISIHQ